MSDQPNAGPQRPDSRSDAEVVLHTWEARVHVLSNPSAWSGVALSLGGGALGLGLLFIAISKRITGLYVAAAIFGCLMLVFVLVGGIITGSLTGMAVGQLARSEQDVFIPYGEVTKVKVSGRRRYILAKGHWGQKPIGLSCKTADFSEILHILRERCSSARFSGDA